MTTTLDQRVDFTGEQLSGLLNSIVVPRPLAWVSTRSSANIDNLAPHSYFTVASDQPPVVQFTSIGAKDTLRNVRQTGEFVLNIATFDLVQAVNTSGTDFPPEQSEFEAAGLRREPSLRVRPPRVAASPVIIECRVAGERVFPNSVVVFGEVVHIAVRPEVLRDGRVAVDLLDPLARLAGPNFAQVGTVIELPIVPYAAFQENE